MLNIKIICVGKLKEKYWKEAVSEYSKRLNAYCKLAINEVRDEKISDSNSSTDKEKVKDMEEKQILKNIKDSEYVICLDLSGEELNSIQLSEKLEKLALTGTNQVDFIIGGSLGIGKEVLDRADEKMSFSKLTFPHQMIRTILLEQIYRAFKISRGEVYHK